MAELCVRAAPRQTACSVASAHITAGWACLGAALPLTAHEQARRDGATQNTSAYLVCVHERQRCKHDRHCPRSGCATSCGVAEHVMTI